MMENLGLALIVALVMFVCLMAANHLTDWVSNQTIKQRNQHKLKVKGDSLSGLLYLRRVLEDLDVEADYSFMLSSEIKEDNVDLLVMKKGEGRKLERTGIALIKEELDFDIVYMEHLTEAMKLKIDLFLKWEELHG